MLGVEGTTLTEADRDRLLHPRVGGVILFARNYESPAQLRRSPARSALREPPLPSPSTTKAGGCSGSATASRRCRRCARWASATTTIARRARGARRTGAASSPTSSLACGVDFSFTPVLDLDHGASAVIGIARVPRGPRIVAALAGALCAGLHAGGMATVGKHFPGHGRVAADSHVALPVDPRPLAEIAAADLAPFATLIDAEALDGVMPAHIVYPASRPSRRVLAVLAADGAARRARLRRLIFSDDLEMAGAQGAGDIVARADARVAAGCDIVLACNDFAAMDDLLARWTPRAPAPTSTAGWRGCAAAASGGAASGRRGAASALPPCVPPAAPAA
jgi:beta-N-acetylhexosaminidase